MMFVGSSTSASAVYVLVQTVPSPLEVADPAEVRLGTSSSSLAVPSPIRGSLAFRVTVTVSPALIAELERLTVTVGATVSISKLS